MSGLNPDGLGNTERFSNSEGESLGVENADTNSFETAMGVDIDPIRYWRDVGATGAQYEKSGFSKVVGQVKKSVPGDNVPAVDYTVFYSSNTDDIFITDDYGGIRHAATFQKSPDIAAALPTPQSQWVIITEDGNAYWYTSESDIGSDSVFASVATETPLGPSLEMWNASSGGQGVMWAEYAGATGDNTLSIRRSNLDVNGFETVRTINDARHYHNIDRDPYEPDTFYVTTGDADDQVHWERTTDGGATWNRIVSGGGQRYRACSVVFDREYVYWAMDSDLIDSTSSAESCKLLRAERSDIQGTTEVLADLADEMRSWGAIRVFRPNGILIGLVDEAEQQSEVPLMFYDLDSDRLRTIKQFPVLDGATGTYGLRHTLSFQDQTTGEMYLEMKGLKNERQRNGWISLTLSRLMTGWE